MWEYADWDSIDFFEIENLALAREQAATKDSGSFAYDFAIGTSVGALGTVAAMMVMRKTCAGK